MNFNAAKVVPLLSTATSIKSAAIGKDQSTGCAVAPFGWRKRRLWVHKPKMFWQGLCRLYGLRTIRGLDD
jgi:hypothetical protein